MAIRPPRLDDRTYSDLVEELVRRIPAHTPEYTDPRPGDPGRTLIELFAWMTDTLLYRVNFIPERQRLEFLRMVNLPLRGAQPATGVVGLMQAALTSPTHPVEAFTLRPFAKVKGAVDFETRSPVTVLPVQGEAWFKRPLSDTEEAEMEPLIRELAELYELGDAQPRGYVATPAYPKDQARPQGLDLVDGTVDGYLSYEDRIANFPTVNLADEPAGQFMLYSSGTTGRP